MKLFNLVKCVACVFTLQFSKYIHFWDAQQRLCG